jgi:hypothetical protein
VGFEREGFEHFPWCSCFVPLHSVEFSITICLSERSWAFALGGWPPSWLGGWCLDLFVEDCEEALAFPFVGSLKWL